MPQREARFSVSAPPQELWRFLRDFRALCTCIPGVERIDVLDERTAELTVRERIGAVPLVVALRAEIDAEDPPRRLHATARAEHLTMAIEVALEPSGAGTAMLSRFDVRGEGPLKPVVDRLFERRATERTAQFAQCLQRRFAGVAAPPPAQARGGWLRAMWRLLLGRFSRRS
ncbi:MAG TPA: SRPBCC domain-containing protein [Burkholderiales bacterium]|nr:SRPBCC domain-containing protein [Burkholderiales bacterium]